MLGRCFSGANSSVELTSTPAYSELTGGSVAWDDESRRTKVRHRNVTLHTASLGKRLTHESGVAQDEECRRSNQPEEQCKGRCDPV